jgi:hypothetical protein
MDFKTFYRGLTPAQRQTFAERVHTTPGYCHQLAYGKKLELGLADAIVAVAPDFGGSVALEELNLTDRAAAQHEVRKGAPAPAWNGEERRHTPAS